MELRDKIKTELLRSLKEQMAINDLNPTLLSEFAGLGESTVPSMMKSEFVPNVLSLCKIAKVLRVSLDDLIPREVYQ